MTGEYWENIASIYTAGKQGSSRVITSASTEDSRHVEGALSNQSCAAIYWLVPPSAPPHSHLLQIYRERSHCHCDTSNSKPSFTRGNCGNRPFVLLQRTIRPKFGMPSWFHFQTLSSRATPKMIGLRTFIKGSGCHFTLSFNNISSQVLQFFEFFFLDDSAACLFVSDCDPFYFCSTQQDPSLVCPHPKHLAQVLCQRWSSELCTFIKGHSCHFALSSNSTSWHVPPILWFFFL